MTTVNITVENDHDFYRTFQYVTAAVPPVPIDLTGAAMEMMLRRKAEDQAAVLRLATDTGEIVITQPLMGEFTVKIDQGKLLKLGLGDFAHSNIMSRGLLKTKIWSGSLTNNPGPTR